MSLLIGWVVADVAKRIGGHRISSIEVCWIVQLLRDIVCIVTGRESEREVLFEAKALCRSISGVGAFSFDEKGSAEGEVADYQQGALRGDVQK